MASHAIAALRLMQFRSHASADFRLDPRPVAIYGPNGAGKTNILEAVSLLSPGRGLRRARSEEMALSAAGIGWKLAATLCSLGQVHEIETSFQQDGPRQVRIDEKAATQLALGRIARVLWLVPAMDRLWIEGADGRRRFLDRATLNLVPDHAEAVLVYEKAMRERNRLLKDAVRDDHWYGALETQMAAAAATIIANRKSALTKLNAAQEAAETTFPAADLDLTQPDHALPEAADDISDALAGHRPRDLAAGRTLVGPHRTDLAAIYRTKEMPARNCSTGEQKALLISLILANARAIAADFGAPPILLLDEVAAHLDADRRSALYDEVTALGAQAWMTGTGPELFAELGDRAQYVRIRDAGQGSVVEQKCEIDAD